MNGQENYVKINTSAANAPPEVMRWVNIFQKAHDCPMNLSKENNGYHLYIPCPECLKTHGEKEIEDPKYSINLSMLAGLGDNFRDDTKNSWMPAAVIKRDSLEKRREYGSSICMRTKSSRTPHRFAIDELRQMSSVTERHSHIITKASLSGSVGSAEREEMWEEDFVSKTMCPPPAGKLIRISKLPLNHPAVAYLTARDLDCREIEDQFRLSFCVEEYPYSKKNIFYRKMPGAWKDTPRHRIIFHSLIENAPLTWQARLIEKVSEDGLNRLMLHPYAGGFQLTKELDKALRCLRGYEGEPEAVWDARLNGYWVYLWSRTHTRANVSASWQAVPPFDESLDGVLKFKPSKYRTAKYSSRQLMGWDAAIKRANEDLADLKWCVLLEGPIDAARVGPGGIAMIGSSLSHANAEQIVKNFNIVFTALDADRAGKEATEKITKTLYSVNCKSSVLTHVSALAIPEGKDVGDLTQYEYEVLFNRALKRSQRPG